MNRREFFGIAAGGVLAAGSVAQGSPPVDSPSGEWIETTTETYRYIPGTYFGCIGSFDGKLNINYANETMIISWSGVGVFWLSGVGDLISRTVEREWVAGGSPDRRDEPNEIQIDRVVFLEPHEAKAVLANRPWPSLPNIFPC